MNRIPEKLINFRAYENGTNFVGLVDAELPKLEAMTETVKGAGIAGEYDSPVIGHYQSMELSLSWRTPTPKSLSLAAPKVHQLDLRGAIQVHDAANGTYRAVPLRVTVNGIPKSTEPGKLEVGSPTDSSNTLEVTYYKVWYDGKEYIEIDKLNFICKIDGVDYLAAVRLALGG
ncbi:phage major tail tube protein [Sporomusa sphaeroides DSM 2875]|uniref:phage major tail tube protein n=1 Tax=Sporomusa sphaeroides TaxID=47679 RepID=UPI00202EE0A0|nr:phage major tail tube protein [Sporomusa sphaeroides]MCM0759608.1 phage major tail tube protein [Sporomusa sphaeroides DSM 2875]